MKVLNIISPTANQQKRLQDLLDKFCLNNLRVAKKKTLFTASAGRARSYKNCELHNSPSVCMDQKDWGTLV
jgi:hypothetical protein